MTLRMPCGSPIERRSAVDTRRFRDITGMERGSYKIVDYVGFCGAHSVWLAECQKCGATKYVRAGTFKSRSSRCMTCSLSVANQWHYSFFAKIKKTSNVVEWKNANDFAASVGTCPSQKFTLRRKDESKPWGPGNFEWVRFSKFKLDGFASMQEVADAIGVTRQRVHQLVRDHGIEAVKQRLAGVSA